MVEKWVEVCDRQAGAVTASQLREAGISALGQRELVDLGLIERVDRGIYVQAGRSSGGLDWRCLLWIELLKAGTGAFACWRSAAALWRLDGIRPGHLDVGVAGSRHPRRASVHRLRITPTEIETVDGVRCTEVGRTILDLGALVDSDVLERAIECGLRRKLITLPRLQELSTAIPTPGTVGSRRLEAVLSVRPSEALPTESDAETLFAQVARRAGLPEPARQFTVILRGRRYRLDFAWPMIRLAIEVDSAAVHGPDRLTADLARQNQIVLDGWMIVRFSWYSLAQQPQLVERDLLEAWALRTVATRRG